MGYLELTCVDNGTIVNMGLNDNNETIGCL